MSGSIIAPHPCGVSDGGRDRFGQRGAENQIEIEEHGVTE
ncbi:hypothetical protein METP3_03157 [Methanosarcinales archaeon]|nr:hypothetical protein METP3_03157 [Methanosarcinales archaeon]